MEDMYLNFLNNILPELVENVPLNVRQQMIYQNDGAPAHSSRNVVDFLNEQFQNRRIG